VEVLRVGLRLLLVLLVLADCSGDGLGLVEVPILMIGAFGPLVASFLLTYREQGPKALLRFAARALRYRIPAGQLSVALLLTPVLAAIATYLHSREGGPAWAVAVPFASMPALFLLLFFLGGSFQEEFGWAYAIDRMQKKWPTLLASALLGIVWAFWHLPLFFIPGLSQFYMPFWSFLLLTIALRIIGVSIYNAANRSILATLLFHTSTNFSMNLFPLIRRDENVVQRPWTYFALLTAAAAVCIAWPSRRRGERPVPSRTGADA
jgi:membrane protease YdiL (CAAX protease family)